VIIEMAAWVGNYVVDNSCSRSQCCCLSGTVSITTSSNFQYEVSGPVAGQCGIQSAVSFAVPYTSVTGNTFTTSLLGQTHVFTLSSNNNVITDVNENANYCSGSATRITKNAAVTVHPSLLYGIIIVIGILVVTNIMKINQ
jgi:hypothetical protein